MAQAIRCRPSALLGVVDSYVAFCVDRAVFTLASAIEEDQNQAESRLPTSAKSSAHTRARQRVLDQYLGITSADQTNRFRSVGGD